MSNWRERAQQELARVAAEEAAKRANQEAIKKAAEDERQRKGLEKEEVIRRKARRAREVVAAIDELELEQTLGEINQDVWEGRGAVQVENESLDGITIARRISLSTVIPHQAVELTEPVYRQIFFSESNGYTDFLSGEYIPRKGSSGYKRGKAGVRVTGSRIENGEYVLDLRYGFDTAKLRREQPFPDTGEITVIHSEPYPNESASPKWQYVPFDTGAILLPAINESLEDILRRICAERLQDPFSARIERAFQDAAAINARIGEFRQDPGVRIKPGLTDNMRDLFGR